MKLRAKIRLISMVPIVLIILLAVIISVFKMHTAVNTQAYNGMEATALAITNIFNVSSDGEYYIGEDGDLYKGELNISQSLDIVDDIKNSTGLEVTVFYGDTRYLTTIEDNGVRQVGTKASEEVIKTVLQEGQNYGNNKVNILGTRYICYYVPLYQNARSTPVGMVFVGERYSKVLDVLLSSGVTTALPIIIIGVIFMVFANFIGKDIVNAVNKSIGNLSRLADGQLGNDVDEKILARKDVIGDMGRAIKTLDENLTGIITELQHQSKILEDSSVTCSSTVALVHDSVEQISATVQEVASATTQQAQDAVNANENIVEMGELISNTNTQVGDMTQVSGKMTDASASAKDSLSALGVCMDQVEGAVETITVQTNLTHESVEKIAVATEVISNIASQTNLLSLNASIEAARAGENGKGFAVVAEEIKALAEQSSVSADQIRATLHELQGNSKATISGMEQVRETVEEQRQKLQTADEMFNILENGIEQSTNGVNSISKDAAVLDEKRASTVDAVENVAGEAEQISAHMQETAASVELVNEKMIEISEQANGLKDIATALETQISKFNINL